MKKFLRQIKHDTNKISLNPAEKSSIRTNVVSFMEIHPVRNGESSRHTWQENMFSLNSFLNPFRMIMNPKFVGMVIAAVLVSGAGISYAAENAVPGNILYPMKLRLNEKLRGAITLSTESKADWQTSLLERRLQEAAALAARGGVDADTEVALAADIESQHETAAEYINTLEDRDEEKARELQARLEALLDAYASLLAILTSGDTAGGGNSIVIVVNASANAEANARTNGAVEEDAENTAALRARAEASIRQAEHTIERVTRHLSTFESDVQTAVAVYMNAANTTLIEAKTNFATEQYLSAMVFAHEAKQYALQAEALAEVVARFGVTLPADATDLGHVSPPQGSDPLVPARQDPPGNPVTPPVTGTFTRPTGPISNPRLDIELPTVNLLRRQAADRVALAEKTITDTALIINVDLKNKTEVEANELFAAALEKYQSAKELFDSEQYKKAIIEADLAIELCATAKKMAEWQSNLPSGAPTSGSVDPAAPKNTLPTLLEPGSLPTTGQVNANSGSQNGGTLNLNTDILGSGGSNPLSDIPSSALDGSSSNTASNSGTYQNIKPLEKPTATNLLNR